MRRFLVALFLFVSLSASASTYVVNDTDDASDANPGDDVCATAGAVCTLRAAIEEANAHAGSDTITFGVIGTINPATEYPSMIETTVIDGTTAPGYLGVPLVTIDGAFSVAIGLHFDTGSDDSLLTGLQISGFSDAGVLSDADGVSIRNNYLGPVTGGTPNEDGLELNGDGSIVGGEDGLGNVISGNEQHGIVVTGSNHRINDNLIGTDALGTGALANGDDGIHVTGGATAIEIGGLIADGAHNIISGNTDCGIEIEDADDVTIAGNFIGTDLTGTLAVPNFLGIYVGAANNVIGTADSGNVISGNEDDGIDIDASDNVVRNNLIGTDATGLVGIGNGTFGVAVFATTSAEIDANVVSFNGSEGIFFFEVDISSITGNIVGLDSAGTGTLGNGLEGILLLDCSGNVVDDNTVSGNSAGGIVDAAGFQNIIENNRVGTTADGNTANGNLGTGIELFASVNSIVRSNVVSANDGHGIEATLGSVGAEIYLNIAGLSADLSTPMGNTLDGINVCDSAEDTVVGSVALGGNIMSANLENGLGVEPTALLNNTWAANSIYDNGLLGIDIEIDGVTANDPDDADEGANNLQNFPELDSAVTTPSASQVLGTIDTTANTAYTVHFYSSPAPDDSGFGEGETYLGEVSGTTDANGDASFSFTGPALTIGHVVTATATTSDGTSEFSEAHEVTAAPQVSFDLAAYSVGEAGVSAIITVTRSGDLDAQSTVDFATSDDTATAGSDYTANSGTLTFVPGDASETFSVLIANDGTDEPDELVTLTLSNPTAATLAEPSVAQLTILDDDAPPSITIDDVPQSEGTSPFEFTVSLSQASAFTVTVSYATADGTATAGSDYTAIGATTLTFAPGVTSQPVSVNVTGDTITEPDETFVVNLSNAENGTITDEQGLGTIENDDADPVINIDDVSEAESATPFVFTLSLDHASASDITINYSTASGTATAGSDYTAQTDVATITAGTLSTTISIPVTSDTLFETDETFFVNLTGATNATIGDDQGLGTIENDDGQPGVSIDDVPRSEAASPFAFTLTLSEASAVDVTVNYATANGTALAGSDYTAQTSSATITAGNLTTTINIPVTNDALFETDETFFVNLTGATNATITDDQGLGTIENDDLQPSVSIGDVSELESAGPFVFTLTLSAVSGVDVTVNYATEDDTATAGSDYTAQSGTATIPAGSLTTTISVPVTNDALVEADETFFVNLTGATNATITDDRGLGTIENDEGLPSIGIDSVSDPEGDSGTTDFVFTIELSAMSALDVTVEYATADDSATAGSDYIAQTGTATIPAGSLTTTVTVPVSGDTLAEGDETFFVNLSGATNATIADDQGEGTIEEDDTTVADLSISKTTPASSSGFTSGDTVTYTIEVRNAGPQAAATITVTDELPPNTTFVSATSTDASCSGTTTVTCTIPSLAAGVTATIELVVTVTGGDPISNTASVSSPSVSDPAPSNDEATVTIVPAFAGASQIPTASEWALLLLALGLATIATRKLM